MEFTYIIKKADVKKYLKQKHHMFHVFCILFFILFFMILNFRIFANNKILMATLLVLCLIIVCLLMMCINYLYIYITIKQMESSKKTFGRHHVIIDQEHIEDTIHNNKISFLWKDIRQVKYTKDAICIYPKEGHVHLVFHRTMLKDEKFNEAMKEIKKYYKK